MSAIFLLKDIESAQQLLNEKKLKDITFHAVCL